MAIERWEMLLSSRADSYLLKIRGPREDAERIVHAHASVCGEIQEISDDVFQWAIFVVDAPLAERLAIQNLVMSITVDPSGRRASAELGNVLDGLSGALEGLTNLTDDEQAFLMKKMAQAQGPQGQVKGPLLPPDKPAPARPGVGMDRATPGFPGGVTPKPPPARPIPAVTAPPQNPASVPIPMKSTSTPATPHQPAPGIPGLRPPGNPLTAPNVPPGAPAPLKPIPPKTGGIPLPTVPGLKPPIPQPPAPAIMHQMHHPHPDQQPDQKHQPRLQQARRRINPAAQLFVVKARG